MPPKFDPNEIKVMKISPMFLASLDQVKGETR